MYCIFNIYVIHNMGTHIRAGKNSLIEFDCTQYSHERDLLDFTFPPLTFWEICFAVRAGRKKLRVTTFARRSFSGAGNMNVEKTIENWSLEKAVVYRIRAIVKVKTIAFLWSFRICLLFATNPAEEWPQRKVIEVLKLERLSYVAQ